MFGIPTRAIVVVGVLAAAGTAYLMSGGHGIDLHKVSGGGGAGAPPCQVTVAADVLNVRSGPADDQPIVATLSRGQVVRADRTQQNGFRMLGDARWAYGEFLAPVPGSDCG